MRWSKIWLSMWNMYEFFPSTFTRISPPFDLQDSWWEVSWVRAALRSYRSDSAEEEPQGPLLWKAEKYTHTKLQACGLCCPSSKKAIKFIESGRKKKHSHHVGLGPRRTSRIMRKVSTFQPRTLCRCGRVHQMNAGFTTTMR